MNTRLLSPYEQTQLARHGLSADTTVPAAKPIEYITSHTEFCGLDFFVDTSVLIPRVETEGLVELVLQAVTEKMATNTAISLLEVGTGSGAIIISLAKHLELVETPITLMGSDISTKALKVAQYNEKRVLHRNRVTWIQSDLFSSIPDQPFNIVVANLPYVPSARIETLDSSVKDFEPIIALDGGFDGFQILKKLLDQSTNFLTNNGILLLEVDSTHTLEWFSSWKHDFAITPFTDCYDRHRFVRLDLLPRDK